MVICVRMHHVHRLLPIRRWRRIDALGHGEGGEPNPVVDGEDNLRVPRFRADVQVEFSAAMPHTVCNGLAVCEYREPRQDAVCTVG